jgi:hypothetical protein
MEGGHPSFPPVPVLDACVCRFDEIRAIVKGFLDFQKFLLQLRKNMSTPVAFPDIIHIFLLFVNQRP